jgi:hypothetical protein
MLSRVLVVLALLLAVSAFAPLSSRSVVSKLELFPGKKKAPAPAAAPVKKASSGSFFFPGKKAAPAPSKPSPAPLKKAAPAPLKKVAPAPVKKVAPAPVKKVAPSPVKKVAPAPVKKVAPAPVKKVAPATSPAKKFTPPIKPAPAKKVASIAKAPTSSSFAYGLVGSDLEAGEFDPFKLSVGRSPETISWYRAAELKHGRVSMLAALGLFIQPLFHLPDEVFASDAGYGAVSKLYAERPEAIWQILVALAAIEISSLFKNGQGNAGDLGWDPLNFKGKYNLDNPDALAVMQLKELKNGRLAMLGASGLLLQEVVTGSGPYGQGWLP